MFSGCAGQKTVKSGNNITVDYIGRIQDGKVFDTSIETVAKDNNLFMSGRDYKPYEFTVGKEEVIKGLDEGVVGMKVGETKTLIISPEKAYGQIKPELVQAIPIIQVVPKRFPRIVNVSLDEFERTFGTEHKTGDNVTTPGTNMSLTVRNISTDVSLYYNFKVGDIIPSPGAPWNETVVAIDDKNFTVEYSVKKNDTIQFFNVQWNTTVIDVNNESLTLKHNPIPDAVIQTMFGPIKVSFNETSIIMDRNLELAGKTLIFNITLKSID